MTFEEEKVRDFLNVFAESKNAIRHFPGCRHLELWRDRSRRNIFFTYSFWESETALENYRNSELFKNTWSRTKVLFAAKPEAWSVEGLEYLP